MNLTVLLADAAQSDRSGKISALGLGWVVIPTPTPPMALVVFVDLEKDEFIPAELHVDCVLTNGNGQPLAVERQDGPVGFSAVLQAAQRTDPAMSFQRSSFTVGIGPGLPLEPGSYQWTVSIKGSDVAAATRFSVVPGDADRGAIGVA